MSTAPCGVVSSVLVGLSRVSVMGPGGREERKALTLSIFMFATLVLFTEIISSPNLHTHTQSNSSNGYNVLYHAIVDSEDRTNLELRLNSNH